MKEPCSEEQNQINLFCSSLTLHYLCAIIHNNIKQKYKTKDFDEADSCCLVVADGICRDR